MGRRAGSSADQLHQWGHAGGLREVLPPPLVEGLKAALRHFDRRIAGFAGPDAVLIAPETRTTAPLLGPNRQSTTVDDLLPVGEGAGYAGGIVSAALDGYRAAVGLVERFSRRWCATPIGAERARGSANLMSSMPALPTVSTARLSRSLSTRGSPTR